MTFPTIPANGSAGYNLTRSVRTRASASANLSRTFGAAPTVRTKQTLSVWFKRGTLSTEQVLMAGYDGVSAGGTRLVLLSGNTVEFHFAASTSLITTQVFRDPSAWYHFVLSIDTTQATASNRVKLYVNGLQITAFGTANYPSQNALSQFTLNNGNNKIASQDNNANYFDGYLAEVNFIDGQALTPSSFGSFNTLTGVWQPAQYTGTYGTNGFELQFTDNSGATATTIGKDFSGNGNNWTPNNISVTAGVTYDSMTDVPTLTSATAANYCVLNPVNKSPSSTVSNGNLRQTSSGGWYRAYSTIFFASTAAFYAEATMTSLNSGSNGVRVGIANANSVFTYVGSDANSWSYDNQGGKYTSGTLSSYGASYAQGDIVSILFNNGSLTFYKNGVSQGVAYSGLTGTFCFAGSPFDTDTVDWNFGQRPFSYSLPSGALALNTYNLPTSTIVKGNTVMDATLYTGTGASLSVTNTAAFKPDLVWVKSRSAATTNKLTDSVRGVTKGLSSNSTDAESTDTQGLTAFGSAGFTVGTNTDYNNLAATYVAWQWQAGQGTNTTNTNGTITSTVSVNASAGFSVVTYTGTGANATVGHGLGVAPSLVIVKQRNDSGTNWLSYHASLGATQGISLDSTSASNTSSTYWNNTAPTSSVFSIGTTTNVNRSTGTYVAYCWTPIAGFSAFGSYTGNSSTDGPFVYTGFRPKYLLIRRTDAAASWLVFDSARDTYNAVTKLLRPNLADAEATGADVALDFLSNGFKLRQTSNNINAGTIIYAAYASNPFKNSLAF